MRNWIAASALAFLVAVCGCGKKQEAPPPIPPEETKLDNTTVRGRFERAGEKAGKMLRDGAEVAGREMEKGAKEAGKIMDKTAKETGKVLVKTGQWLQDDNAPLPVSKP